MANKIEYYNANTSAWVDISSYVTSCPIIPRTNRNRDWTLRIEQLSFTVAVTVRDVLDGSFNFANGHKFRIYINDGFIHGGYCVKSVYDFREMVFNVTIKNNLGLLQNKLVDASTLFSLFETGTNWYDFNLTPNNFLATGAIVGVLWAMKQMFAVSGLTLDTTDVDEVVLLTHVDSEILEDCTTTFQDLFFYVNVLFCVGQSVRTYHTNIDSISNDYNRYKKNCFDVISEIITSLRLHLVQTDLDTFKLEYNEDSYTLDDDDTFEYEEETIAERTADYTDNLSYSRFTNDPSYYTSLTITDYESITYGKGPSVNTLQNFFIYFSDAKTFANKYNDGYNTSGCYENASINHIENDNSGIANINSIAMRVKENAISYSKKTFLTNFESVSKSVVQHGVDLEWTNSEIIQESY